MKYKINMFLAWFFIPLTLVMGWVAFIGRMMLELLGVNTHEGDIPGRLVGSLLLFGVVFTLQYFLGNLPPEGKPGGNGFRLGHRLVMAGNLFSSMFIIFQFSHPLIQNRDLLMVLDRFTDAFGYWVMAFWVVGFSFLYQSSLPKK